MKVTPRLAIATLFVLVACSQPSPVAEPEASPAPSVTPSASPSVDLAGYSPPDFDLGGMGIWTKSKFWAIHDEPDISSESTKLKAFNPAGQYLRLLVVDMIEEEDGTGWFEVLVPERPNGSTGWVESNPKSMELDQLPYRIEVDLSEFELNYYRAGTLVETFEVGVGTDENPTPIGTFYVWASVPQPDPNGPYGLFALGLSGFAPELTDWPGGGRAAIHGTADESDKGSKVSHGCVRVFNEDMKKLKKVPLGTPVLISA